MQHSQLLSDVLVLLPTQGWDRPKINDLAQLPIDCIVTHFLQPLEMAGMDTTSVMTKWNAITEYAKQYLNLVKDDYTIWWKLLTVRMRRSSLISYCSLNCCSVSLCQMDMWSEFFLC